jgi:cytosine/adenosine deaminase-related metal-dependent hydrolase
MIKHYSADYILPVSSAPLPNGVVSVNETGEITGIYSHNSPETQKFAIERLSGILTPGFINSHCHLELSYLENKVDRGLGLIRFIETVIGFRKMSFNGQVGAAMKKADETMQNNGIVAVGDVCNSSVSRDVKKNSSLFYHTFVEMICFEPEKAGDILRDYIGIKEEFEGPNVSLSPHAPYSVCKDLFRYLNKYSHENGDILSMHNQESEDENKFYRYKTGGFVEFYKRLGRDIDFFKPQARNSLQSILPLFLSNQRIVLVHNTYTSLKDLYFARRFGHDIFWCFCPKANLYIEGKLPKIELFLLNDLNITLGTDSLASNDTLCILSELKTLASHYPAIPLVTTIGWATLNGARLFNIAGQYGSLEIGKKPGLNLITHTDGLSLTERSEVRRIA